MTVYNIPLTERQELFCRHVARGASAAGAARAAGYAMANAPHQGSALLGKPHVRQRVEELRFRRENARQLGISELVDMLRTIMTRALETKDLRTAVRCVEVEARLCGFFPDRLSHDFVGSDPLLDGIDPRAAPGMVPPPVRPIPEPTRIDAEPTPTEPQKTLQDTSERTPESIPERTEWEPPAELLEAAVAEGMAILRARSPDGIGPYGPPGTPMDPHQSLQMRIDALGVLETERLVQLAPPVATSPDAPAWARDPDPMVRGTNAELFGWRKEWTQGGDGT